MAEAEEEKKQPARDIVTNVDLHPFNVKSEWEQSIIGLRKESLTPMVVLIKWNISFHRGPS